MASARQHVSTESPYEPKLGIARAVRIGNVIAVAGTAPIGYDGQTVALGDAATQAQRCLDIIYVALEELGADLSQVISDAYSTDRHCRLGKCRTGPWRILS